MRRVSETVTAQRSPRDVMTVSWGTLERLLQKKGH
jgi:hypothetical protein